MSEPSPPVKVNSSWESQEGPGLEKSSLEQGLEKSSSEQGLEKNKKKRTSCEHNARKDHCNVCQRCEHGKRKDQCAICYDCGHGKLRFNCHLCMPLENILNQKKFCHLCTEKHIGHKRARAQVQQCASCDEKVPDRTEVVVRKLFLAELGPDVVPSTADNALIGGCGFGRQRPDLSFVFRDRVIIVEVDENGGHPNQASSCEATRMSNITEAIHVHEVVPVIFLRFNPDRYHEKVTLEDRIAGLAQLFWHQASANLEAHQIYVHYAYQHRDCKGHIEHAKQFFNVSEFGQPSLQCGNLLKNESQTCDLFE